MTDSKVKKILDTLNYLQETLLSIPDDMFLQINPRNNVELDKTDIIKQCNEKLPGFMKSSSEIEKLIKIFFDINPEFEEIEEDTKEKNNRIRIIKELDKTEAHSLDENFTYKRPYGYILLDKAYKGLKTWRVLYKYILKDLKEINIEKFHRLKTDESFISKKGRQYFSEIPDNLRVSEQIIKDFYIETNLSANQIRDLIKDLLDYFEISTTKLKIYLRKDHDA
ncbi:MAG: hypothetical protein M0P94_03240 [Candidatus Absconditabacterales bacterium]|nr:hypothetical protein [Candidatus Absconditabacterales bacterium]